MTFTDTLIEFATKPLMPSTRACVVLDLSAIDWAACAIAGTRDGPFADWAAAQPLQGPCATVTGQNASAASAALINGTLSHALDYDDTHFGHIGHPSVVIFPAVFAAGPRDWTAMCDAALVGFEASIRIGMWLGRAHYQNGFHQTATAGAFGACLGAARVLDLSPDQMRHALGVCATMASGLKAQFGTMGKPLNAGLAARAGIEAAQWAATGMSGATDGLSAFAEAHGLVTDPHAGDGLGTDWQVETLSHKFHACCHGLHATLEALRALGVNGEVDDIQVFTHPRWLNVCNIAAPDTGLAAKFSYKQVVAMALCGIDTGDIASFSDGVARDLDVAKLRDKIHVTGDDTLTEMQARVVVSNGSNTRTGVYDLATLIPEHDLAERVRSKSATLIGSARAAALWVAMRQRNLTDFNTQAFQGP